jgi:hypothetical protein
MKSMASFNGLLWSKCAAFVSRVWQHSRAVCNLGPLTAVARTGVAHEDCFLLDAVSTLAVGCARVDRVFVVEAPAGRVAFDNLIAHLGSEVISGGG